MVPGAIILFNRTQLRLRQQTNSCIFQYNLMTFFVHWSKRIKRMYQIGPQNVNRFNTCTCSNLGQSLESFWKFIHGRANQIISSRNGIRDISLRKNSKNAKTWSKSTFLEISRRLQNVAQDDKKGWFCTSGNCRVCHTLQLPEGQTILFFKDSYKTFLLQNLSTTFVTYRCTLYTIGDESSTQILE